RLLPSSAFCLSRSASRPRPPPKAHPRARPATSLPLSPPRLRPRTPAAPPPQQPAHDEPLHTAAQDRTFTAATMDLRTSFALVVMALLAPSAARAAGPADALAELLGPNGPQRFAVVRDGLFRGGQPTARHLELLRAAGERAR